MIMARISEEYKDAQARMCQENLREFFMSCGFHSLNLDVS